METIKEIPKLEKVPETLLIPLRARYLETQKKGGIISDPKSCEILNGIDYDFSGEKEVSVGSQIGVAIRTEILDERVKDFLSRHPESVVVNLGCGLDTRFHRLDNGRVTWFDLDLPESIALRKRFFHETDRFKFISKSVLDFSWLDQIPSDCPVLFVAEGLLMYFTEDEVKKILTKIRYNFLNAEMVFEAMSPFIANRSKKHPDLKTYNASFKWGIKSGKELENWDLGINFITEWYYFERHQNKYPLFFRLLSLIPAFRKGMKIIHIRFSHDKPKDFFWLI